MGPRCFRAARSLRRPGCRTAQRRSLQERISCQRSIVRNVWNPYCCVAPFCRPTCWLMRLRFAASAPCCTLCFRADRLWSSSQKCCATPHRQLARPLFSGGRFRRRHIQFILFIKLHIPLSPNCSQGIRSPQCLQVLKAERKLYSNIANMKFKQRSANTDVAFVAHVRELDHSSRTVQAGPSRGSHNRHTLGSRIRQSIDRVCFPSVRSLSQGSAILNRRFHVEVVHSMSEFETLVPTGRFSYRSFNPDIEVCSIQNPV